MNEGRKEGRREGKREGKREGRKEQRERKEIKKKERNEKERGGTIKGEGWNHRCKHFYFIFYLVFCFFVDKLTVGRESDSERRNVPGGWCWTSPQRDLKMGDGRERGGTIEA
jgi:hypothetical protein